MVYPKHGEIAGSAGFQVQLGVKRSIAWISLVEMEALQHAFWL